MSGKDYNPGKKRCCVRNCRKKPTHRSGCGLKFCRKHAAFYANDFIIDPTTPIKGR
jgi:hypothetical protein